MSKGFEEVRLLEDGRWCPTGQLRDQSPYGTIIPMQSDGVHTILGHDTNNVPRPITIIGAWRVLPVGQIGWAPFSR